MRFWLGFAAIVAAFCVGSWTGPAAAGMDDSRGFTASEAARLEAGHLVQRRAEREQGSLRLVGGSSWQVIDARPEVVWKALLDTQHYPRMMPQVLEAKLVAQEDRKRTVFMRQGASGLVEKTYYLDVRIDEGRKDITFSIDEQRPHDLRAAWGFYTVRPYKGGRTLLAYGVMADIGDGLLVGLVRDEVHEWMLRTPWMIKRFVEGSGRALYEGTASRG